MARDTEDCRECGGTGTQNGELCVTCNGTGHEPLTRSSQKPLYIS